MVFAPYIALGSVAPLLVSKRLDEHNIDLGNRLYSSVASKRQKHRETQQQRFKETKKQRNKKTKKQRGKETKAHKDKETKGTREIDTERSFLVIVSR